MLRRLVPALLLAVTLGSVLSGCHALMGATAGWSRPTGTATAQGADCVAGERCRD